MPTAAESGILSMAVASASCVICHLLRSPAAGGRSVPATQSIDPLVSTTNWITGGCCVTLANSSTQALDSLTASSSTSPIGPDMAFGSLPGLAAGSSGASCPASVVMPSASVLPLAPGGGTVDDAPSSEPQPVSTPPTSPTPATATAHAEVRAATDSRP